MRRRAALNPLCVHFNVIIASLHLTVSFWTGPLGGATVKSFPNMVAHAITRGTAQPLIGGIDWNIQSKLC